MNDYHYDDRCYELATDFLEDEGLTDARLAEQSHYLAIEIQKVIEDYLDNLA